MSNSLAPSAGGVLSADIAVPEHEREARFYSRVLSTGTDPLWREHDLMNNLGTPVIGLGERTAEYAHLPLQWMPHIQVADVPASVQRALDLGGTSLLHAEHEGTIQWAVLLDPGGAAFGIIPVVPAAAIPPGHGGAPADTVASVGRIAWLDLTVTDAAATRNFYQRVVAWSVQDVDMEEVGERYANYNMLDGQGRPAAGICHARGANAGLPPVWILYLPVGDLAESLRRVREEGGEVVKALPGGDGVPACAVVRDPVGACFGLVPG